MTNARPFFTHKPCIPSASASPTPLRLAASCVPPPAVLIVVVSFHALSQAAGYVPSPADPAVFVSFRALSQIVIVPARASSRVECGAVFRNWTVERKDSKSCPWAKNPSFRCCIPDGATEFCDSCYFGAVAAHRRRGCISSTSYAVTSRVPLV